MRYLHTMLRVRDLDAAFGNAPYCLIHAIAREPRHQDGDCQHQNRSCVAIHQTPQLPAPAAPASRRIRDCVTRFIEFPQLPLMSAMTGPSMMKLCV